MRLILIVICALIVSSFAGPLCYNCDKIANPFDCPNIVQCEGDQQCYGLQFLSIQDNKKYWDINCKSPSFCNAVTPKPDICPTTTTFSDEMNTSSFNQTYDVSIRVGKRSSNRLGIGDACCKKDFCNAGICIGNSQIQRPEVILH